MNVLKGRIDKQATVHTLRHSFATHMIKNGVNIQILYQVITI
ncbi:MAG: hypothetical protein D3907_02775 [Candidatus Electrothrix sp. AUS3]|nr:hypothetical protein [Candidatus Electrothrix gigas]